MTAQREDHVLDAGAFPDATTTGVPEGTTLRPSGGLTITTPGQAVSGLNISGAVDINVSNVTLQNCIINVTDTGAYRCVSIQDGLTGIVIKNCEVIGPGSGATAQVTGIHVMGASQTTIDACNVHEIGHGIDVSGGPVVIKNCYIHGFNSNSASHYDGVFFGGADTLTPDFSLLIQNNTIINNQHQTSAVFLQNVFGPINNVTITGNYLAGGGYTSYCDATRGTGAVTNISYTNNAWTRGYFGLTSFRSCTPTWTGNYDYATHSPLNRR